MMRHERLLPLFAAASRFFLVALFVGDVAAKVANPFAFVSDISSFAGGRWAIHAAVAVLLAEAAAVVLLLVPRTARAGGVWALVLLIVFAAYGFYYVHALRGGPLDCKCFGGVVANLLGISTVPRSLLLLIPAAAAAFGPRLPRRRQAQ